jgi:hypothetical protein
MSSFYAGLDLGQAADYTALAVVEAVEAVGGAPVGCHVRHLERYPLGTTYPTIVEDVARKIATLRKMGDCMLTLDHTGCGRPVFDLFARAGLSPIGVTITAGDKVERDGRVWRVPKRDLVSTLTVAFQTQRLKVAAELPAAKTFTDELENFKVKIDPKTAHDSYGAWREGAHDDLVLAVALACWTANEYSRVVSVAAVDL